MKKLLWNGAILPLGLGAMLSLSSARAGGEFEPTFPKFPYGPTDPHGDPYCVAATDLVYTPKAPYVRISSEAAKLEKSKRSGRRPVKKKAAAFDAKGSP